MACRCACLGATTVRGIINHGMDCYYLGFS